MEFDIETMQQVDSLEAVPEPFRPLYVEKDKKFTINDAVKPVATAIAALQKANKASRKDTDALKKQLQDMDFSDLHDFGKTPKEIATAVKTKLEELQAEIAKGGKINPEKIKEELAKGFAKEKEQLTNRNSALTTQLYTHLVESVATNAIVEEKGMPELLMPFLKDKVKVVEEDGKFNVYVVDAQGDRRFSGTTGSPMTIKELVKEMKANEKYARLFDSTTNSGGGKQPGTSQGGNQQKTNTGQLSPIDKIRAGLDKGQAKHGDAA